MNPRMLEDLARLRLAEVRRIADGYQCGSPAAAAPAGAALARTRPARRMRPAGSAYAGAGTRPARDVTKSLRARTGWRLVDLGLRLALQSDPRNAASPRPAGS
jgi:hypothetical protein